MKRFRHGDVVVNQIDINLVKLAELLQILIHSLDFRFGNLVQHIRPKDKHRIVRILFDFGKDVH